MTGKPFTIICFLVLGACGTASASPPSSSNPAHCIAAFHYGRTIALRAQPVEVAFAVQSTARSLYEGRKLKAGGQLENGRDEGEALLAQYAGDEKVMMGLLRDCALQQDADPEYRALNESGTLMAAARKVDPTCRDDATCRSKIR